MPTLKKKYINAKITHVNSGVDISWQLDDNSWTPAANYSWSDSITRDAALLVAEITRYMADYNTGVDVENSLLPTPVPTEVTDLLNQPLF